MRSLLSLLGQSGPPWVRGTARRPPARSPANARRPARYVPAQHMPIPVAAVVTRPSAEVTGPAALSGRPARLVHAAAAPRAEDCRGIAASSAAWLAVYPPAMP